MNIEEIKNKVEDYKHELIISRECCDVVDLSDEVLYLLSIIEQSEKALEEVYECGSIKQAEIISGAALKAIRGK